jgi:polyisoprenoid-binding protein YceI
MVATTPVWRLDQSDGQLLIRTGVQGRAARMGHRLTIAVHTWQASITWAGDEPAEVALTAEVNSLDVLSGEGGVTPLSGPEKVVARSNALRVLNAKRFARITFESSDIEKTARGYRLTGTVRIRGTARAHTVDVKVAQRDGAWHMSSRTEVCHSDFGIKPYSMLMGAMKVADAVTVSFAAASAR